MKKIVLNSAIIVSAIVVALLIIELVLALFGVSPIYQANFKAPSLGTMSCDDEWGCHWDYANVTSGCTTPFHQTTSPLVRHCYINETGHFDTENFESTDNLREHRILFLGDSITFGYSADVGRSWAEIAEQQIQDLDVTVWNASVPGTGTEQAIINLKRFVPELEPQLVVLAFNLNDLYDNLLPIDQWYILDTGTDEGVWVRQYRLTDELVVEHISPTALYFRIQGVDVTELTDWQRLVLSTRIGTIALPNLMGLQVRGEPQTYFARPKGWYPPALEASEKYLREIKLVAEQHGIQLLVMLIPDMNITDWNPTAHDDIIAILEEFDFAYIRVDDLMTPDEYINENPNDRHWNNSGHGKAGQRMGTCLRHMLTNNYAWCPDAVVSVDSDTP